MTVQGVPRQDLPKLGIYGLKVSRASDSTLEISAGRARDSSNKMDIGIGSDYPEYARGSVTAPLTVDVSAVGANGIDAGSLAASKVYAVYVIGDSSGENSAAGLVSLSSNSSPTMPFGYDAFRLVGFAATDATSDFLLMVQTGEGHDRALRYDAIIATAVTAGASTTYADVDLSTSVPPVEDALVVVQSLFTPATADNLVSLQKYGATSAQVESYGPVATKVSSSMDLVPNGLKSSVSNISYKVSNASDAVAIKVAGFEYSL